MRIAKKGVCVLHCRHLRLDQDNMEEAKKILNAKTEIEALDKVPEKLIQEVGKRLRPQNPGNASSTIRVVLVKCKKIRPSGWN